MAQGKIKWFDPEKGYGFITPIEGSEDSKDIFVTLMKNKTVSEDIFVALNNAPPLDIATPGLHVILQSRVLGSINIDSPVSYN